MAGRSGCDQGGKIFTMGNCSSQRNLWGVCHNSIRVLKDSGGILQFKAPKLASEILNQFPGYGIFQQGKSSVPFSEEEALTSGQFYLLPLKPKEKVPTEEVLADNGVSVIVEEMGDDGKLEEAEPAKKSFGGAYVENLANGSGGGLEVLPRGEDGIWRVKLVLNTKQLEEILSVGNTLALIETMRMAATVSSTTPKLQSRGLWGSGGGGWNWKPIFSNMFRAPMAITAPVLIPDHSGI